MRKKSTITRTWLWGLGLIVGGLIVGGIGIGLMFASGTYVQTEPGVYNMTSLSGIGWLWAAVGAIGFLASAVGGIVQLVAWIGAMILTYRIHNMTWFLLLLILGLLSFQLIVMLAYVLAGPDETQVQGPQPTPQPPQPTAPQPPSTLAPSA